MSTFRILWSHGNVEEFPEIAQAEVEGEHLVCRDAAGRVIARFDREAVTAYGHSELLAELTRIIFEDQQSFK